MINMLVKFWNEVEHKLFIFIQLMFVYEVTPFIGTLCHGVRIMAKARIPKSCTVTFKTKLPSLKNQ